VVAMVQLDISQSDVYMVPHCLFECPLKAELMWVYHCGFLRCDQGMDMAAGPTLPGSAPAITLTQVELSEAVKRIW